MKRIVLAILALAATPAFGSYLEACDLNVTVEEVVNAPALDASVTAYTRLVKLNIESAEDRGSHIPSACEAKVGTSKWLTLDTERVLEEGDALVISYFYVNNRGPEGILFNERWTIVD